MDDVEKALMPVMLATEAAAATTAPTVPTVPMPTSVKDRFVVTLLDAGIPTADCDDARALLADARDEHAGTADAAARITFDGFDKARAATDPAYGGGTPNGTPNGTLVENCVFVACATADGPILDVASHFLDHKSESYVLGMLAVAPAHRKRGVAQRLLEHVFFEEGYHIMDEQRAASRSPRPSSACASPT